MNEALKNLVRSRAGQRCEYCRLHQLHSPFATFHVEHIRAIQHGGNDGVENLALACDRCNAFKGPNLTGIDVETGRIEPLFNPRVDSWRDHFRFDGSLIVPLTAVGRATVETLNMNHEQRVVLRQRLIDNDEFDASDELDRG